MPKIQKPTSQELHDFRAMMMERFIHSQTYDGEIFSENRLHTDFVVELKYTTKNEFKSMECRVRISCWNDYSRGYPKSIRLAKPIKYLSAEYVNECMQKADEIEQKLKYLITDLNSYSK